jgi:F-type H+-transporting ATPase subunit delta
MEEATHAQTIDGYAEALLAVARAEGDAEGISDELFTVAQSFSTSNELRETLSDMRVPTERKLAVISDLLGARASDTTISLVEMLVSTGRIRDFVGIAGRMSELAAAAEDQVVAEVRSAIPLDEATLNRLADRLAEKTGKPVSVRAVVDPSVIGGVVARVGDTIFDGSVRNRLQELREAWG